MFEPTTDIRILRDPTVYLVGRQLVDPRAMDRFLADHGVSWETDTEVAAEHLTEVAGRVCYMSFAKPRPGGNKTYLDHILEVGHGSVLEHAAWNFIFVGVSRTLTHELVRHRAGWAYSQLSQRYVDESVAEYVEPDSIKSIHHGIMSALKKQKENQLRDHIRKNFTWDIVAEKTLSVYNSVVR